MGWGRAASFGVVTCAVRVNPSFLFGMSSVLAAWLLSSISLQCRGCIGVVRKVDRTDDTALLQFPHIREVWFPCRALETCVYVKSRPPDGMSARCYAYGCQVSLWVFALNACVVGMYKSPCKFGACVRLAPNGGFLCSRFIARCAIHGVLLSTLARVSSREVTTPPCAFAITDRVSIKPTVRPPVYVFGHREVLTCLPHAS